jgi:Fe-Mn family superoxide dismutase
MSEEVLTLHHTKHHQAYVNAANELLNKLEDARNNNIDLDFKSILKGLSFAVSGHVLHSIFWQNMASVNSKKNIPSGEVVKQIEKDFGGFERFKIEFSKTAISVEGSGWAVLVYDKGINRLLIMQLEKHNANFYPETKILLALDVWEHSYYLDYKNDRSKFVENWWNIVNWQEVEKRLLTK